MKNLRPPRFGISILVTFALTIVSGLVIAEERPFQLTRNVDYADTTRAARELQSLDVYWKDNTKRRAVIIYVHDGGWAFGDKSDVHAKPGFFALHDFCFVSMNYRLRWDYQLYDQLEDIVSVVKWVKQNQQVYGFDAKKIILMGHGAGAHLVSLVGTSEDALRAGGLSLSDIRTVVAIDTQSFDIAKVMRDGSFLDKRRHRLIFGENEKAWTAASPITHVQKDKNMPSFALLYVADSEETSLQAREFSKALRAAEVNVIMIPGNKKTAQSIDEELGVSGDVPTLALTAFLHASN